MNKKLYIMKSAVTYTEETNFFVCSFQNNDNLFPSDVCKSQDLRQPPLGYYYLLPRRPPRTVPEHWTSPGWVRDPVTILANIVYFPPPTLSRGCRSVLKGTEYCYAAYCVPLYQALPAADRDTGHVPPFRINTTPSSIKRLLPDRRRRGNQEILVRKLPRKNLRIGWKENDDAKEGLSKMRTKWPQDSFIHTHTPHTSLFQQHWLICALKFLYWFIFTLTFHCRLAFWEGRLV